MQEYVVPRSIPNVVMDPRSFTVGGSITGGQCEPNSIGQPNNVRMMTRCCDTSPEVSKGSNITQLPAGGRSVAEEGRHQAGGQGRPAGQALLGIGRGHRAQAGVQTEPAQRFGFPALGAVSDPGQPGPLGVPVEHQVGQRPAGQIGGADAVTDVAAGPAPAGAGVQADGGVPVPGDPEWSAPAVAEAVLAQP